MRADGRGPDNLRPVEITKDYLKYADASVLIELGDTKVICAATMEERVPSFLKNSGKGWITAEYSLLPRSTQTRTPREAAQGRVGGRTYEIQRLIGRSLRAVADLEAIGEKTVLLDCDVIQADGGTRTASITGAFVALYDLFKKMRDAGLMSFVPLRDSVAAVSVGIVDDEILLDLTYEEDSRAQVDMNIAMTGSGRFVEVQGTAETMPFDARQLSSMLDLARRGVEELTRIQMEVLGIGRTDFEIE